MSTEPRCGHPGCRRDADYRVSVPGADEPALRCRWHAEALWRPHGAAARVEALHGEVPEIVTSDGVRRTLVPALIILGCIVVVAIGFEVIAKVMLAN